MQDDPSMGSRSPQWAGRMLRLIHDQLSDRSNPLSSAPCGHEVLDQLLKASDPSTGLSEARLILEGLESRSDHDIKLESAASYSVSLHSRRLYTDCRLLHSLLDLQAAVLNKEPERMTEQRWESAVTRLDMAIIIAGAPRDGRLDLSLDVISVIQDVHLPMAGNTRIGPDIPMLDLPVVSSDFLAPNCIPRVPPPSIQSFQRNSSSPFILPGFINDWPALTDHPWSSPEYLLRIAGRGRVVPVEVGSDYRAEEWSQKIIPWEVFLQEIGMNADSHKEGGGNEARHDDSIRDILYLAQHTLLTQFPALRDDIVLPDYVYCSLSSSTFPTYKPPCNDDQLIINAWLGPRGTLSPAHTDPYFNLYAQVVGRKTVWLAPPHLQDEMYPFSNPNAPHSARDIGTSSDKNTPVAAHHSAPSLSNTSRVDVFAPVTPEETSFPLFESLVRPRALCAVLQPGDLLYIPVGWWHAMQSEDVSFSVSMWF